MKYYGKAQQTAQRIVDAFERGDIPAALAARWIRNQETPCSKWSISNQILTALAGTQDARGCRQWNRAGRHVKKGEKAFYILVPCLRKSTEPDPETGEELESQHCYGFRAMPVFGVEQTQGDPVPEEEATRQFIEALPLLEVARAWDIEVTTYNGNPKGPMGKYRRVKVWTQGEGDSEHGTIALGTENAQTWTHELMHAADVRLGTKTEEGQHWRSEAVAELGGLTLLELIGNPEADPGAAYEYIKHYAEKNNKQPISVCNQVLTRVAKCIDLILETAHSVAVAA